MFSLISCSSLEIRVYISLTNAILSYGFLDRFKGTLEV